MATKRTKSKTEGTKVITKSNGGQKWVNKGTDQYGSKYKEIYRTDTDKNVTKKTKTFSDNGSMFGVPLKSKTVTRTKYKGM